MRYAKIVYIVPLCALILLLNSCSGNADEHAFEQQATSTSPSGIMAMTANGTHKEGTETDTGDWQIGPAYRGLVEVITPAFPNPVSFNSVFYIELNIKGLQSVVGLYAYAFQQSNTPIESVGSPVQGELSPGFISIPISASFANSGGTGTFGNVYRILIYDGNNRLITYGDVQVE